ncbi:BREX system P-loop protein BrxC [Collinsella aerofaciens]|uniref:ATPase n=1 Tax=Collinsella aerofaciens TaxID=74426 RepID=A0A2D1TWP5_9ACTN|nr:BREX system P-loop protein BrxC [Collinsella aerofaciens]ATP53783.1 ATPase [Collinsella aerofaciens]
MDNTIIRDLFAKDINRSINGVVKVQDSKDGSIRQELDEYVVTRELQRHFATFFKAYGDAIDVPTDKIGVWISGFFGSGKSHFLKMLSYLLENRQIGGKSAIRYFDGKIVDPMVEAAMERACSVSTQAILFNIDSKAGQWKQGDTAPTALLRGFERMFYEARGFYGEDLKLAKLEEHIDSLGKTQEFREAFERVNGESWLQTRDTYSYFEDDVVEVLQSVLGMSEKAAWNWLEGSEDEVLAPDVFAKKVKDYVDAQAAAHGGNYRLLFMVDEVGQFITNDRDPSLMLSLQTIVEELGAACGGRVWVMVTSQEAIDNLSLPVGNDFSKIQGRFNTRLSLSSSSVDEVIQRRVLEKTAPAADTLAQLYKQDSAVLKNNFTFEESRADLAGYANAKEFVASYPFVGYQFKLLPDVMTEVRKHGVKAKHMSTGERSMLSAFQESAQAIQHEQTGALVPFWRFFDTISKDLEHGIIQVVVCAERASENAEGLESYDVRVLKLLYLIRYIGYVKASVENISIFMIDSLDVDKRALKDRVKESLARLERENYVARQGDTYSFLTDEEQEIAQEIAQTPIDNAKVIESIKKRLFDSIYTARKLNRGTNDFPFDRYVDGSIHGSNMGGMELSVVTMASDLGRADDAELALKSVDKAIVALSDEVDYWAPLVNAAKICMYAQTRNLQELPPSTRQIVEAKMREKDFNEKEADILLSEAVLHARCAVDGRMVEVRAAKPAQVFEQVLAQLCDVIFSKAGYIGAPVKDDSDIRSTLAGNIQTGLDGMDAGNARALKEVEDYLRVQHQRHLDTAMGDIQRKYQQKPYGWREINIANVVAQLVVEQRAQVLFGGQTVQADDSRMVALLRKDADKAQVRLRMRMSDRLLRATGELMCDLFDLKTVPSNEDKLVAELKERLEGLREACLAMARDYYTGIKPAYPYPGEDECEKMRSEVADVLKDQNEAEAFLTTFTKHEERLLDAKEDFDKVVEFFESNQRTAFDHARDFLNRTEGIEYASDDIPGAVENVATVREILKDPKPYGRIKDLQPLMDPVEDDMKKLLGIRRNEFLCRIESDLQDLRAQAESQKGFVNQAKDAIADAGTKYESFKNRVHSAQSLNELSVVATNWGDWLSAAANEMYDAVDEARVRMNNERRTTEVMSTGEVVKKVSNKGAASSAPVPAPKPQRKIKTVRRADLAKPSRLLSAEDVERYVDDLRSRLMQALAANDEIRIN